MKFPTTVDYSDPVAVVTTFIAASETRDLADVPLLCDPFRTYRGNQWLDEFCYPRTRKREVASFIRFFADGAISDEPLTDAIGVRVPVTLGQRSGQHAVICLIEREVMWFVLDIE